MADKTFKKRAGTTDRGKDYEDLMLAALVLKLVTDDSIDDFNLSSNDENFGAFDDIVLEVHRRNHPKQKFAIQLKHVNKGKVLTKSALMESRGNFSITKYFEDFKKLKFSTDVKLLLFTNLKFDVPDGETIELKGGEDCKIEILKIPIESLLNTSPDGRCYKFGVESGAYGQFFEQFFLCVNQVSVDKLKKDVSSRFQEMFCCNKRVFDEYLSFVTEWSIREGKKIKLDKKLMRRIIGIRLLSPFVQVLSFSKDAVSGQSQLLREAIFEFDVTFFCKDHCDSVKRIYGDLKNEVRDIDEINQTGNKYQVISKYVKDLDDLTVEESTLLLWLCGKCPLIVTESNTTYHALNLCHNEKFVVLSDDPCRGNLKSSKIFTNLSDLKHSELYTRIVQTFKLALQEKDKVTLQTFIENCEELRSVITTNELVQMLDDSFTIGGKKEVLPVPQIDRLVSNVIIDNKFLQRVPKETIIVITCDGELDQICTTSATHISHKAYFKAEFEEIWAKNPNKNHHHLRIIEGGHLEWVRSQGAIAELDEYRCNSHFVEEAKLFDLDKDIEIVCAEPGMGKSVLARNVKNHHLATVWTILVSVKEHCSYFDENPNADDFINFVVEKTHENGFGLKLLTILVGQGRLALIWDGLDELFPENLQTVLGIIDELARKGFKQLLTSRNHLKQTLETKFGALSRTIKPFDGVQQIHYIIERLPSQADLYDTIIKIKKNIEIVKYGAILGIPLQIYMLTELFRQDPEKYGRLLDETFSIADLYTHFVDEKFSVYYKDKADFRKVNDAVKRMIRKAKRSQLEQYEKAALKALFKGEALEGLSVDCDDYLEEIRQESDCFGIITGVTKEGTPSFLHNSYGEFFAAIYFYKNHKQVPKLKEFIFDERYTNVRFLFDLLLANNCPVYVALVCKNFHLVLESDQLKSKDQGGRNLLHLACSWGQRYPLLTTDRSGDRYIIDEAEAYSVVKEDSAYRKCLEVLTQECDPFEVDDLFNLTAFGYADKSLCLLPIVTLARTHRVTFGDLSNFKDIPSVVYYSAKFDYSIIFDILEQIPMIGTKTDHHSLLHVATKHNSRTCVEKMLSCESFINNVNDGSKFGTSPIFMGCWNGNTAMVRLLIDAKADVNGCNHEGYTPMYVACMNGYTELVRLLINAKADVNGANETGYTPTYVACHNGHTDVVRLLIDNQANVNAVANNSHTPIYIASFKGLCEIVDILINANADVNVVHHDDYTPLYVACMNGHAEVVQLLIDSEANVNAVAQAGRTSAFAACQSGHTEIVRLLIDAKADVNLADTDGYTPLYVACYNGFVDLVPLLIDHGVNINAVTKDGRSALYIASYQGHPQIVRQLIDANADVNVAYDGYTSIYVACQNGHAEVVQLLINASSPLDFADNDGYTPLHVACQNGHFDIVGMLVNNGASVDACTRDGRTPMYMGAFKGHLEVVRRLIDAKANVNVANGDGLTPLHGACINGFVDVVRLLIAHGGGVGAAARDGCSPMYLASFKGHCEVVRVLIDAKADVNVEDGEGLTSMHVACQNGHGGVVQLLIDSGGDVNVRSKCGSSPMQAACALGRSEVVRLLIGQKAAVNGGDSDGDTPLHEGCSHGFTEIVGLLIDAGADVSAVNKNGLRALDLAVLEEFDEIVEMLNRG